MVQITHCVCFKLAQWAFFVLRYIGALAVNLPMLNKPYKIIGLDKGGCPVCSKTQSGCSLWSDSILCRGLDDPQTDKNYDERYTYARMVGQWAKFVPESQEVHEKVILEESKQSASSHQKTQGKRKQKAERHRVPQAKKVKALNLAFKKSSLPSHMVDFLDNRLQGLGKGTSWFCSLEGQAARLHSVGLSKTTSDYYLGSRLAVAIKDFDGQIVGAQLRALNKKSEEFGKYLWLGHEKGAILNQWGEQPLQVVKPTKATNTLVFVEGCLKPIVLSRLINGTSIVVGAIGGMFGSSPTTLKGIIKTAKLGGVTRFLLATDAGWFENPDVQREYEKLEKLAEELGVTVKFVNSIVDGEEVDADETSRNQALQNFGGISPSQAKLANQIADRVGTGLLQGLGDAVPLKDAHRMDTPKDASAYMRSSFDTFFIDRSDVGAGKSWALQSHAEYYDRIIYISQSPRKLTTKWLCDNSWVVPSRHQGLVKTSALDGRGEPIMRIAKKNEEPDTMATCEKSSWHRTQVRSGLSSQKACESCPLYHECNAGGDGSIDSHYLFLRNQGNHLNKKVVATTVQGFSPSLIDPKETTLIVVDEADALLVKTKETFVDMEAAGKVLARLDMDVDDPSPLEVTKERRQQGDGTVIPVTRYRLKDEYHEQALQLAYGKDKADRERAARWSPKSNFRAPTLKNYSLQIEACIEGYEYVAGQTAKSIVVDPGTRRLINTTKGLVEEGTEVQLLMADATLDPRAFLPFIGLEPEDVQILSCDSNQTQHVTITRVRYDGFQTNKRTEETQDTAKRYLKQLQTKHKTVGVVGPCQSLWESNQLGFFSGSRGSNQFQEMNALMVCGSPKINLGVLADEFNLISKHTPLTFKQYCDQRNRSELVQVIGRLRAGRRTGEQLYVYLLGHFDLDSFEAEGYQVDSIWPQLNDPTFKGAGKSHLVSFIWNTVQSLSLGNVKTQATLASHLGKKAASISRSFKRLGTSFKCFLGLVNSATDDLPVCWADIPVEDIRFIKTKTPEQWRTSTVAERKVFVDKMRSALGTTGCKGFKMRDWFQYQQVAMQFLSIDILVRPSTTTPWMYNPLLWWWTASRTHEDFKYEETLWASCF